MPPSVIAATAPPQRDARADQPQVIGVVVLGLKLFLVWPGGAGHLRQLVQAGQGCPRGRVVLALGFVHIHCHTGPLPPVGRSIRFPAIHRGNRPAPNSTWTPRPATRSSCSSSRRLRSSRSAPVSPGRAVSVSPGRAVSVSLG